LRSVGSQHTNINPDAAQKINVFFILKIGKQNKCEYKISYFRRAAAGTP
jgi:hypothetical protein